MPAPKKRDWAQVAPDERGVVPALHRVEETDNERLQRLKQFRPMHTGPHTAKAVDLTARQVLVTKFKSLRRDRKRMQRLVKLAEHHLAMAGDMDWTKALSDLEIDKYCQSLTHCTQGTRNSYRSSLRADAEDMGLRDRSTYKGRRPAITSAYTEVERHQLWLDADHMYGPYAQCYRLVYDLAFAAGARAHEMSHLTWDMIVHRPQGAVVTLVNRNGVVREVPIGPIPAARLLKTKGAPSDYVFRPDKDDRRAVVNKELATPTGRSRKSAMKLPTARNTFIVNLLRKPVPFVTVAYLADLNPGGSVAQNLLAWAGATPSPQEHALAVWGELS